MMQLHWTRVSRQTRADLGLAAAFAIGTTAPILASSDSDFVLWGIVWSLVMWASITVRRVAPMLALLVASIAGFGMVTMIELPLPALLAVPVVTYSVARYQDWSGVAFVAICGCAGSIAGAYAWTRTVTATYRAFGGALLMLLFLSILAVSYLAGRLVREAHLTEQLDREIATQRFTAAQRQSEQESQIAVGRARAEVAQELHDVLAHSLSIIVVQAEGARALTTKQPEAAAEALTVIADTGRRSIGEVRRIVSLMRGDGKAPSFGPSPSLSEIATLIDNAGERVSLTIEGDMPLIPESLGLAAYRVVQESLTNFLKHAGPTAVCEVIIRYTPECINLTVRDDGMGAMSYSDGHGSGVPGMRERVQSMGGDFKAGPRPGGGYYVQARLPMPSQLGKSWLRRD